MAKKRDKKEVKALESRPTNKDKFSLKIPNLKKLFFKPNEFLNSVEKENEYWPILSFLVLFYLISFLLSIILGVVNKGEDISYLQYIYSGIMGFIGSAIFYLVLPFIVALVVHLGVLIFGGRQGFFNTFKPMTYSLMIGIIYSFISLVIIFILQFIIPIDPNLITSMQNSQNVQDPKIIIDLIKQYFSQPLVIIGIIISIISMIHQFVFEVKGISKFQKISKIKAFLALILIPLTILVLIFLALIWVSSQVNLPG